MEKTIKKQPKPITRREYTKDLNSHTETDLWMIFFLAITILWVISLEFRFSPERGDKLESRIESIERDIGPQEYPGMSSINQRLSINEQRIIELNQGEQDNKYNYEKYTGRDEYINCVEQNGLHTND